ncbi:hypothetical protein H5410_011458 [Solanum commersonii]|uniref:RING-type E3 ubiquitin transferase n=1 Tax=Solanum commersonii TaxID=4109 RepID=A0A9J6ANL6_SOLCO|nr:hypothetical protein H5410_011458 [Solanum commersonii]
MSYKTFTFTFVNILHCSFFYLFDIFFSPTSEFIDDDDDVTTESESDDDVDDIIYLLGLLEAIVSYEEGNDYEDEEEVTEEIIGNMMKTRIHCGSDDGEEIICVICQCEYENDETIGTLECQHEYHSSCIKEWLLKGKRSCPICRSSVLPS